MSSVDARSLFAAAREDGPDDSARDAVFRKIALTTGAVAGTAVGLTALSALPTPPALGVASLAAEAATSASAAGTSAAASAAATGGAFGMKLLAIGVALGAVSTALGVLLAVTVVTPESTPTARTAAAVTPATAMPGAKLARPEARKRDDANANAKAKAGAGAGAEADGKARAETTANADASGNASATPSADARSRANANVSGGDLAEEARLVTAARGALLAGDPARALVLVQNTRKLGTRSLEPEELGLEARALRALGRADDAAATELLLRRRYPDHALAR